MHEEPRTRESYDDVNDFYPDLINVLIGIKEAIEATNESISCIDAGTDIGALVTEMHHDTEVIGRQMLIMQDISKNIVSVIGEVADALHSTKRRRVEK